MFLASYVAQYDDEADEVDGGADSEEFEYAAMMTANRLYKHWRTLNWTFQAI